MSEESCNHDCSACGESCGARQMPPKAPLNEKSSVRHVIAVVSGKGGVGKSMVTALMAVKARQAGYATAILDADITGPSIPKAFGIKGHATGDAEHLYPAISRTGVEVMSMNLLLEKTTDPVVWRGPIISNTVTQFWSTVVWGEVEYMFVDMPPGTGDVPLTVFQSIQVDGIVVVTSPQELVSMIVAKIVKMAELMKVPVLGLVENMSYFECPNCGEKHEIFGHSHIQEIADQYHLPVLGRIPMVPQLASECDAGQIETFEGNWLDEAAEKLIKTMEEKDQHKD